jgi:hypothetical protein
MRRLIVIIAFVSLASGVSAQTFKGFFSHVPSDQLLKGSSISWAFRPAATVTAVQLMWDKDAKTFNTSGFMASAGVGLSLAHFKAIDGTLRSDYGVNLLYLFDTTINGSEAVGSSLVASVTAFESISFGGGYNFGQKTPVILIGLTYNFNRPVN